MIRFGCRRGRVKDVNNEVVMDRKGYHDNDDDGVTYELSAWYEPLR